MTLTSVQHVQCVQCHFLPLCRCCIHSCTHNAHAIEHEFSSPRPLNKIKASFIKKRTSLPALCVHAHIQMSPTCTRTDSSSSSSSSAGLFLHHVIIFDISSSRNPRNLFLVVSPQPLIYYILSGLFAGCLSLARSIHSSSKIIIVNRWLLLSPFSCSENLLFLQHHCCTSMMSAMCAR